MFSRDGNTYAPTTGCRSPGKAKVSNVSSYRNTRPSLLFAGLWLFHRRVFSVEIAECSAITLTRFDKSDEAPLDRCKDISDSESEQYAGTIDTTSFRSNSSSPFAHT